MSHSNHKTNLTHLLNADVRRVEEYLRHREPLVVHPDDLLPLDLRPPRGILLGLHVAAPEGREVGQDVVTGDRVVLETAIED